MNILVWKILFIFILCVTPYLSHAGSVVSKITRVGAVNDQYGMLIVETAAATKPDCAEEFTIMSFDKSTANGRDMYSMALTALAAQKRMIIEYSDTVCGLWANRALIIRMDIISN